MTQESQYTDEQGQKICELIATHSWGLKRLCAEYPEIMPAYPSTIHKWVIHHPSFDEMYRKAREQQQELIISQMNDEMNDDLLFYNDKDGNERLDAASVALATAKANNKKWVAARLDRRRFSEKSEIEEKASSLIEKLLS